jgi:hypothetical protein
VPQQSNTPPPHTDAQPERHVIASPNPTIDDGKTPATIAPQKVEGTRAEPAARTTRTPLKTTTTAKSKPKRRRTKTRTP